MLGGELRALCLGAYAGSFLVPSFPKLRQMMVARWASPSTEACRNQNLRGSARTGPVKCVHFRSQTKGSMDLHLWTVSCFF